MLVKYFAPKSLQGPGTSFPPAGGLPRLTESRKVFFLTKSLNSIRLYASVFRAHTDFRVQEHHVTDSDLGGKVPWTYEDWQKVFTGNDIHLMLDATFEALLSAGFVSGEHVQLLILDDVHKIIMSEDGDDCYTRIIKKLRSVPPRSGAEQYRILGCDSQYESYLSVIKFVLLNNRYELILDST